MPVASGGFQLLYTFRCGLENYGEVTGKHAPSRPETFVTDPKSACLPTLQRTHTATWGTTGYRRCHPGYSTVSRCPRCEKYPHVTCFYGVMSSKVLGFDIGARPTRERQTDHSVPHGVHPHPRPSCRYRIERRQGMSCVGGVRSSCHCESGGFTVCAKLNPF